MRKEAAFARRVLRKRGDGELEPGPEQQLNPADAGSKRFAGKAVALLAEFAVERLQATHAATPY